MAFPKQHTFSNSGPVSEKADKSLFFVEKKTQEAAQYGMSKKDFTSVCGAFELR